VRAAGLPNVFPVGAGKSGTTSLYHYLRQHPQIFMSPIKEPCYFASEVRAENLAPSYRRHVMLFQRGSAVRMDPGDRQYLIGYYRADVLKPPALLNRDLSKWLI
jgi:hypothetical protein